MAVGKKLRFEVFKRDQFRCVYCGRTPPAIVLQCDHVLAVSKGGADEIENLAASCEDCNSGKSNRDLTSIPPSLAEQIEKRREREDQVAAYNAFLMEVRESENAAIERIGFYWFNQFNRKKNKLVFGDARTPSIRRFLKQLTEAEILHCIDIAMQKKPPKNGIDDVTFRYFCGVCWKTIRPAEGV